MSNVILLVIWLNLPAGTQPAFQVLTTTETVKQCNNYKDQLEKSGKDLKNRVACLQLLTPLKDAGKDF